MNIYAFICTRSKDISSVTTKLLTYYTNSKIIVHLLVNQSSIFKAYAAAFEKVKPNDDDICIFCHDDIEISLKNSDFEKILKTELENPKVCFIGPAGTTNSHCVIDLFAPQATTTKSMFSQGGSTAAYYSFGGACTSTSSATGFVLGVNSGTMTGGTIRVYGYRNTI